MRITQGTFSYLPDFSDEEIEAQIQYCLRQRLAAVGRVYRRPAPAQRLLGDVGPAHVRHPRPGGDHAGGQRLPQDLPKPLHQGQRATTGGWAARPPR